MLYLFALIIGIVAGLRAMVAPAAVSWAARLGALDLHGSWLAFFGYRWTPWILSLAALGEILNDKLPATPSRLVPPQFGVRVITGALCGAAVGVPAGAWIVGAILGAIGAVIGTVGGARARAAMARAFGKDLPAALIEDVVAIVVSAHILNVL